MSYTIVEVPPAFAPEQQDQEAIVLDVRQREEAIRGLVEVIRQHPDGEAAEEAVRYIDQILSAQFPSVQYSASLPKGSLKSQLLAAVRDQRPLVLAFTPKLIDRREVYYCTTHFVELAGAGVQIEALFPSIQTSSGGTWRAPGDSLKEPLEIPPFGQVEHEWRCALGPWRGGALVLSFIGSYGPECRRLTIHCSTRFSG